MQGIIDIFTSDGIDRTYVEVAQINSLGFFFRRYFPVFAFFRQTCNIFLRERSSINIILMQNHRRFCWNLTFSSNNLNKLSLGKWTPCRPWRITNDKSFTFDLIWFFGLNQYLRNCSVIRNEHSVILLEFFEAHVRLFTIQSDFIFGLL